MFNIHDLRVKQNFIAFNSVCKRENIDFFLMLDVVKLLQSTLDYGENFFDERIEFERVKDKSRLKYLRENRGYLLLEFGENAFAVKDKTYFLLEEVYKIQKMEDIKANEFTRKNNYSVNVD